MNEISLPIPDGRLNLDLCLRSGQVFRWRKEEDGSWVGVDGGNWYRLWHGQPAHASHDLPGRGLLQATANLHPSAPSSISERALGSAELSAREMEEGELSDTSTRPATPTLPSPYSFLAGGGSSLQVCSNASKEDAVRLFRLDQDASQVEGRILELGPELRPAIDQLQGIRLMRPSSLVETVFTFLCTANNNLHRIIPMCWKLGSYGPMWHGRPAHGFQDRPGLALPVSDPYTRPKTSTVPSPYSFLAGGGSLTAFPTIDRIADIDEQELRKAGFGYRGATIPRAARAILERGGEGWLEELRLADYPDLQRELCSLPGIGPKLADCIALYGYDRGEAVPLDTHIWQAFTRLYHPEWKDKAVTDFRYREATQRFRDRFGALSGWAHLFLFFENLLRGGKKGV